MNSIPDDDEIIKNYERYITVSDLALCQKCPALLAYKIFKREKKRLARRHKRQRILRLNVP